MGNFLFFSEWCHLDVEHWSVVQTFIIVRYHLTILWWINNNSSANRRSLLNSDIIHTCAWRAVYCVWWCSCISITITKTVNIWWKFLFDSVMKQIEWSKLWHVRTLRYDVNTFSIIVQHVCVLVVKSIWRWFWES